jgi:hypothetical protein
MAASIHVRYYALCGDLDVHIGDVLHIQLHSKRLAGKSSPKSVKSSLYKGGPLG